jgi:hypothetical protein
VLRLRFFSRFEMGACFLGVLQCFDGILMRLFRELVGGEMIALAVGGGSGLVSVSGFVMELSGAIVWALGHGVLLSVSGAALQ